MDEICSSSATELATMLRARTVSTREVVQAHIDRIAAVNGTVNAITTVLDESALAAADDVDRRRTAGEPLGSLAGVPFTVKENIDVEGSATTWGVTALQGQIAAADAPVVAHLRREDAIPIARTNLCDFAFRWHTESSITGHTRNPWDLARTPGGSSGGEAAALATGMTPLGLGNDLGGSLRIPSQMCGTAALRPTLGRIADAACTIPDTAPISLQLLNCQGPMARTIADLRAAYIVMCRPDVRDPRHVPMPTSMAISAVRQRVAVVRDPLGAGVDPHVAAGVARAADWLADSGFDVVDAEPPQIAEANAVWLDVIGADFGALWALIEPIAGEGLKAFIAAGMAGGVLKPVDQDGQRAAWIARQTIGAAWAAFSAAHPVILAPVCCERPWPIGDDITRAPELALAMRMVLPVNALGLPSLAVPVGADDGLPQGVQLIGARFGEAVLLDAGEAIERRAGMTTPITPK